MKKVIFGLAVAAVAIAAGVLYFKVREANDLAQETHCVGSLVGFRWWLRECLGKGRVPVSNGSTRRDGELNALLALDEYSRAGTRTSMVYQCYQYVAVHGQAAGVESYRMPDWTREEWQTAERFQRKIVVSPGEEPHSLSAPVAWDAALVHHGCRNVAFLEGMVLRRVPENVFQELRRASEEFVRKPPAPDNG